MAYSLQPDCIENRRVSNFEIKWYESNIASKSTLYINNNIYNIYKLFTHNL